MKKLMAIITSLLLLSTISVSAAAADHTWSGVDRVVAFGDIHGDYEKYVFLLKSAGLVDDRLKWSGGKTHYVQLGDVTDRGPGSRKIVDLIMRLEREAVRKRGRVHFVIGNHEAMNMVGDLRYVHPGEYEAFAVSSSVRTRNRVYVNHIANVKKNTSEEERPLFDDAYRAAWDKEHPLGWVEHRRAWGPGGKYGKWLMKHHAVIKVNDMLFVHGGIGPKYAAFTRDMLNDQVIADVKTGVYNSEAMISESEGPLWYRGLALNPEAEEAPHLGALLANHGVSHIIVGHTQITGAIVPRFGDGAIMIDVGLGAHYGSRDAWLEATGEGLFVHHRGKRLDLPSEGGEALMNYLKAAAALDPQPSPITDYISKLESAAQAETAGGTAE